MNAMQACAYNATDGYGVFGDPPERSSGIWAASEDFDNTKPVNHGGLPGLFSGVQDSTGAEICNDRTPNIGGSNNFERAKIAFPYLERIKGKAGEPLLQTRELFAEEYAFLVQFPDTVDNSGGIINGSDNVFNTGAFVCTKLYVKTLSQEGRLPTADELHNTGYSVPDVVPAGDPDAGAFGFGERLHACDGTIGELNHYGFGQ